MVVERFYWHAIHFGPEGLYVTAVASLGLDDLLRLANRVNDLIARASKGQQGEPRDVTYRARIVAAHAPGRSEDPREDPLADRCSRGAVSMVGGCG